jgi:hypothetical protein
MNTESMKAKWRPLMGIVYCAVVLFDFIIAPILWTSIQAYLHDAVGQPWSPLTLEAGSMFHISMGAVLGVTSWSRGQEKIKGAETYGKRY